MLFSLHKEISFPLTEAPDQTVRRLLTQFKAHLVQQRAQGIIQIQNILRFHGGYLWFSAPSWYLLAAFDSGEIRVFVRDARLIVAYRLSFFQQITWGFLLGLVAWFLQHNHIWVLDAWAGFLLLFMLDYVIAFLRFAHFTRSVWEDTYSELQGA